MKNKISALVAMTAVLGFSTVSHADDGTINFTGNITDTACTVTPTTANQTVNLGTVAATSFSNAGSTAAATRFTISLSQCPESASTASVRFDGNTDVNNSQVLALTSGQTASNVGVAIYEADSSTLIPIGTESSSVELNADSNTDLVYIAKYYATKTPVGPGSANASTSFTVTYN